MRNHQYTPFATITSAGAMLPTDILQRIAQFDTSLGGLNAGEYHLNGEKLNEAITDAWTRAQRAWDTFQSIRLHIADNDAGITQTRERWLLPLFKELGYGRLLDIKPLEIAEKSYPISHAWHHLPIHFVGYHQNLDQLSRNVAYGYRHSPCSLVQEALNRSSEHLWGVVSNGQRLRILRRNVSLMRQSYVEFDLETMMQSELYAEFSLFWLLCHQSRMEAERAADCWLEKWSRLAHDQGIRALDRLRDGVEEAINALGRGLLAHPVNQALRQKLRSGALPAQDYYRQLLRFIYRLIILFVAEDRDILFHPQAGKVERARYLSYYSTTRLRRLAGLRLGTRHGDLLRGLWLIMEKLGEDDGCPSLGLSALNGFLFSLEAVPDLLGCELANHDFLRAIRALAFTNERRSVDYKNIGPEELGSVYESLLELHPEINTADATFRLKTAGGHERKTSGSYYTPTSLINCLLDSALNPVLDEACAKPDPEQALLNLKVCDPACGSGHFLIAAAHRIAKRLAAIRTGIEEPSLEARRAALREVVSHCIYGVDINPMSVELCKVSLWMEAIEPGKPLSFLDAHIQCGNSLLGATPALLKQGIPDKAFEWLDGDDKKFCNEYKKKNKQQRAGQLSLFTEDLQLWHQQSLDTIANNVLQIDAIDDDTPQHVHQKQAYYTHLVTSTDYLNSQLWPDAWCAAFVWKKNKDFAHPITEEIFRDIERNPDKCPPWMKEEIGRLAQQYQFFHWHLAFPDVFRLPAKDETPENEQTGWSGGFDVVLGNPPWERVKIQEKEWFAAHCPDIANAGNAAQRKKMITSLMHEQSVIYQSFTEDQRIAKGMSHLIRNSGCYPLCGRGDINTYTIFAERMRLLIKPTGRIGCIVPSGIATDDTTKFFFQDLMETQSLISLYDFENRNGIFPAVSRNYKFCLLTLASPICSIAKNTDFAFFTHKAEDLQENQRRFALTINDIKLLNPNTRTCPIFRTKRDMELTKAIYERVPILLKEGQREENPWDISFLSMFHMSNDSHLFHTREQLEQDNWELRGNIFYKGKEQCLPLYEGKMIWHYDHRFGTYEGQTQAQANQDKLPELGQEEHANPYLLPIPRSWIHESRRPGFMGDRYTAFLAFRSVASAGALRNAVFSIIPAVLCGNSLPIILLDSRRRSDIVWLLTCLSSFIFDYVTRRKVGGTNMNFFILKQLPVLPPDTYKKACPWDTQLSLGDWILPRALELTYTAWDLQAFAQDCGYDGPPFHWDEERRFLLRCELDAAYFHLYGIAREDVDYIMDTFRVWREKEEKQCGEYRTKRVILEIYDEIQKAFCVV